MVSVTIPGADGSMEKVDLREPADLAEAAKAPTSRVAYAAAHVVADPLRASASAKPGAVDWDATLRQRHRLWDLGLGVAEAMDTAQRGMGITWKDVQPLIDLTLREGAAVGGTCVVGIATDSLPAGPTDLRAIVDAYVEQLTFVEERGGTAVMMASRQLAVSASSPEDYQRVYADVLAQATRPVVLHWLGDAFDPALTGYWGADSIDAARGVVTDLIVANADRVEGIKVSVLDPAVEVALRAELPEPVKTYTGDDYNYVDLIEGDGIHHSHALLGAFAAVAPFAREALARLDDGDTAGFRSVLEPTVPLSRLIFEAPTAYYKTGIVWLAYLAGHQDHFRMLGGLESGRSIAHLVEIFRRAQRIGLFSDPDLTAGRLTTFLRSHGLS